MINNFPKTKYVSLVLENCDEVMIDIEDIKQINFLNISTQYEYVDNNPQQIFSQRKITDSFLLVLKPSANVDHYQFGHKDKDEPTYTVFSRLTKHKDVVGIRLLDNKMKDLDYILVRYVEPKGQESALGAPNVLQKTKLINLNDSKYKKEKYLEISIG